MSTFSEIPETELQKLVTDSINKDVLRPHHVRAFTDKLLSDDEVKGGVRDNKIESIVFMIIIFS